MSEKLASGKHRTAAQTPVLRSDIGTDKKIAYKRDREKARNSVPPRPPPASKREREKQFCAGVPARTRPAPKRASSARAGSKERSDPKTQHTTNNTNHSGP